MTDTEPIIQPISTDEAASTDARHSGENAAYSRSLPDTLPEMETLDGRSRISTRTGRIPRYVGDDAASPGTVPIPEPPQPRPRAVEEPGSTTRLPKFFAQPREGEDAAKGADDSATDSQPDQ